MKKILIILVMFVTLMLLANVNVIAVDQGGEGQVSPDLTLTPNPSTLQFGQISPGNAKTLPSSLTAGTSNLVVNMINVTSTTGNVFTEQNVMFSTNNETFVNAEDFDPINIAAQSTTPDYFIRLTIPTGTKSGSFIGIITYTVMENLGP